MRQVFFFSLSVILKWFVSVLFFSKEKPCSFGKKKGGVRRLRSTSDRKRFQSLFQKLSLRLLPRLSDFITNARRLQASLGFGQAEQQQQRRWQ